MFAKLVNYLKESREEFKKVTWPSRKETFNYSILVVAISLVVAIIIGLFDYALNFGLESVLDNTPTVTSPIDTQPFDVAPNIDVMDVIGNPVDFEVTPSN